MPAKHTKEHIVCTHFTWLIGQRDGVWYADGRSNQPSAGRHSLGMKNRDEALQALQQLDVVRAVELGLADRSLLSAPQTRLLRLSEGRRLYLSHIGRPAAVGGARPSFQKRYRAVLDKFERLHSFRHYICSACANGGVPEQVVMAWLGHRDSEMVRHYYHLHDEESQRQMKRLKFVGDVSSGEADDVS